MKKKINISPIDTLLANGSYPIEFLLYYDHRLQSKKIRIALKNLHEIFWPLFGNYSAGNIVSKKYIENEFFTEEVQQQNFDVNLSPEIISEIYADTFSENMSSLFRLKIIQYKNGSVLIPWMNHLVGDGYSYFYFLSLLAALSQKNFIPMKKLLLRLKYKPHHNRNILKPFLFSGEIAKPQSCKKKPILEYEYISRRSVQERIKYIGQEFGSSVSINDILSSIVLKKTMKIKPEKDQGNFELSIPVDVRKQIVPYGPRFFGNGLLFHKIRFQLSDIRSEKDNLAVKIRQNMPHISKEYYIHYLEQIESHILNKQTELLRPYDPKTGCLVTNISRLPTHKLDFEGDKPVLVLPLTVGINSTVIMASKENYILRYVF